MTELPYKTESTPEVPFSLFDNGVDIWICHHDSPDGQVAVFYRPQDPDDYYNTDQRIGYKFARKLGHVICRYLNKHAAQIAEELQDEIDEDYEYHH
jgi:hypothetical protein